MVAEEESEMNADSPSRRVTVVDVYDLASAIGKDFEHLIDRFGSNTVTQLMPKVISALELLETFASRNERENEEITSLKMTVQRLEDDKEQRSECRKKFDRELEQIEDNYRNEITQLWDMVQRLQDENKRLNSTLEQKDQLSPTFAIKEDDLAVMLTLRETVDNQRDHVKNIEKEVEARQQELETVQLQLEKLQRHNTELLRKKKAIENQGRELVEEKADLISVLQQRDREIEVLKHKLGETEKAKKDLEQSKIEQECDRDNVPRFTLAELREVLQEKNQLKARVMELEEELALLRPAPAPSPQPSGSNLDTEELVVYGPINREPEEKLYPWKYGKKESGVRKFFYRLWSKRRTQDGLYTGRSMDRARNASLDSSASSSKTAAVSPVVHYRHVTSTRKQPHDLRSVLTIRSTQSPTMDDLVQCDYDDDNAFDGAFVAQEFGESSR